MGTPLRILVVEDSQNDAWLMIQQLERSGYAVTSERIDSAATMRAALDRQDWDIVIADYTMPGFSGLAALALCKEKDLDLPFILVSGAIGEDVAANAMKAGAHDYVMKDSLTRLAPAVARELREAEVRRGRKQAEAALRRAHDELEMRVQERTVDLARANAALQAEIAERKQVEAALRASEDRLLTVVSAAPIFLFATDPAGVITLFKGKGLAAMLSGDPSRFIGRSVFDPRFHIPEPLRADIRRALTGESFTNTIELPGLAFEMWYSSHRDQQGCVTDIIGVATNITERKRVEDALQASEEQHRTLVENKGEGVGIVDPAEQFVFANPAAESIFGLSSGQLIGRTLQEFVGPGEFAHIQAQTSNRRARQTSTYEIKITRPDGEKRHLLVTATPRFSAEGQFLSTFGVFRDITARKRMEEVLRASELKFRSVIEQSHDGIFLADEQGAIIEWNMGEEQITGLRREHVLGQALWDVQFQLAAPERQTPEFKLRLRKMIQHALQEHQAPWFNQLQEREIQRADGARRTIETLIYPIHVDDLFALGCVMRDITDRKRAEAALRDSEERYRTLMETSPDPITVVDLNGNFVIVNRRAAELHQFASAQDMIGTNAFDLIAPEDHQRAAADISAALKTGRARGVEYTMLRKDGTRFPAEISASALVDAAGNPTALIGVTRDITDRKRADEALDRERHLLRTVIDNVPDQIFARDTDCRFILNNRSDAQAMGVSNPETLLGKNDYDFYPAELAARFQADNRQVMETGQPLINREEPSWVQTDGLQRWSLTTKVPLRNGQGQVIGIVGIARDVTERRRAEEVRARLAAIVEASDDAIIGKTLEGIITSWNEGAEKTYGYAAAEVIGRSLSILTPPDRADELAGILERLRRGEHLEHFETARRRKDGRLVHVSLGISPIRDAAGQIVGASTIARDITARKQAEEELKRRNEDLIALNAIAMVVSQVVVPGDVLRMALETVLKLTGAKAGTIEVCGDDPGQVTQTVRCGRESTPIDDAAASQARDSAVREVLQTGQPLMVGADVAVYRSHREPDRDWLSPCAAVLIKSKSKVLGVMTLEGEAVRRMNSPDVQLLTAIGHEMGIALENAQLVEAAAEVQVLREVDRLRSELIANVSHELRTPLGLIKLFSTALLAEGFELDRETQHEFLTEIDQETDRLEQLVNNLLDVSRIQSGRLHLSKQAIDLVQLVRQVVKRIELPLTRHQFVQLLPDRAVLALVDPLRFEQVLSNLLSNAVKYSPAGGNVTVRMQGDARQILIGVSDEGLGIPPGDLEKVFERFYRVENEMMHTIGGAGLGLAVARGIVEAHGGRLWVESTLGVGSNFYVSLPVGDVDNGR